MLMGEKVTQKESRFPTIDTITLRKPTPPFSIAIRPKSEAPSFGALDGYIVASFTSIVLTHFH